MFKEQLNKRANKSGNGKEDLWYLYQTDKRGKVVNKVKKDLEYYKALKIPEKDIEIFLSVRKRARHLDTGISFFGIGKIGWGAIIGFIPVVGDFADTGLAWLLVVRKAGQVSKGEGKVALEAEMHANLVTGLLIGLVPVVGDVVDAIFKCNARNAAALERLLLKRAANAKKLAEKEAHAPVQDHTRNDTYYDPELDHRQPHRYESEAVSRVPARYESEAAPRLPARNDTTPATKAPPKYDKQYGSMHERLGMKAGKDSAKKPQAERSGGSWFSRKSGRKDRVQYLGGESEDVAPTRPPRPEGSGRGNGWI